MWFGGMSLKSYVTRNIFTTVLFGLNKVSSLWSGLAQQYGALLHQTTAYHPEANGLVEQFHRHLKSALKAWLTGPDWVDQLPWVLLGIRTTPKKDLDASLVVLVPYGY